MSRILASPERFAVSAFDALLANIAILDGEGKIIAVNRAWERFAQVNAPAEAVTGAGAQPDAQPDAQPSVQPSTQPSAPQPGSGFPVLDTADQASPKPGGFEPGGSGHADFGPGDAEPANANGLGVNYLAICDATEGEDRQYAASIAADIRAVLVGREEGQTEYPCELPDGMHYYLARVSGFMQDGRRYAVVAHEDITRRKLAEMAVQSLNHTLEQRVQERSFQLAAQNAELKRIQHALEENSRVLARNNAALIESNLQLAQFAHVASHDLQEPLRIVGAYSDMLRHRYPEVLDVRGQGYLNHITEQVTRARQMVRDVLAFSSVTEQRQAEATDLEQLWAETTRLLTWPAGTRLHCGPLPEVQANPSQVRQLLGNLLGNSLKFHGQQPLEISLEALTGSGASGEPAAGELAEFVLRDNGVGIAPEYRSQVFGMFQRLQGRTAFGGQGGNGIGLAICKRIVEGHGGSIWVGGEAEGGEPARPGTAIHFTLPLA